MRTRSVLALESTPVVRSTRALRHSLRPTPSQIHGHPWRERLGGEDGGAGCAILVVESDPALGRALVAQLTLDGFSTHLALSAGHARILARAHAPKLAVLGDFDTPRGALDLLEEIRDARTPSTPWEQALPAIVLGRAVHELELLRAFEAGADDYLDRSAPYLELRARVRAVLRRTDASSLERLIRIGPLSIDPQARTVSIHGRDVDLRRLEFNLLAHLAQDPRRVFAKAELMRSVWEYRSSGSTRTLDSHASRLRRKLGNDDDHRWVINEWGIGYRLI